MVFEKLVTYSLLNHQQVRYSLWRNVRPILGWPRPTLARLGRPYPEQFKYNWLPYLPEDGQYTIRPLPIYKMGGRDLESGRVVVHTLGGGNPKKFRWVDMFRAANPDGSVKEERIMLTRYDPLHTPRLALVAGADHMRWIFATHNLKVGDIIRTHSEMPRNPVRAKIGDAHPLGALPVGTKVHCIEAQPGKGAKFGIQAGSQSEIVKRAQDGVTIKLAHGDSLKLDRECMAVVGQMSNPDHAYVHLMCPQRTRWLGRRPRSGQWHRKDGWCGRKIYPPKTLDVTLATIQAKRQKELEERWNFDI